MLHALVAVLIVQSAPVVWAEPAPAPSAPAVQARALPDWALADPFGWERSQCSPLVRREATMEACQARVRTDLALNLGDALPAALRPLPALENCAPAAGGDYAVQCGPQRRADAPLPEPERVCETRPQRQPGGGGVAWTSECRPAPGQRNSDGLSFKLFDRD
jgi:hypothetical protein